LEAQFERHAQELFQLTRQRADPERHSSEAATALESARQRVAETAAALKRMAEGTYGRCERCAGPIPLQQLEILPHTRFCLGCPK
jgi:RNA polymerase-binding transcription factor DksA